jgi:hypothetical protein
MNLDLNQQIASELASERFGISFDIEALFKEMSQEKYFLSFTALHLEKVFHCQKCDVTN